MRDFGDERRCDFFDGRHQSAINCMLISSDKQRLISGGIDGIIKIWCLQSGLLIKSLPNIYNDKTWSIKSMINLPNTNEILICSKLRVLRVLNLATYAFTLELKGHLWGVSCAELLTNETLLSGSFDNTIKVWNLKSRRCVETLTFRKSLFALAKIDESKFVCANNDTLQIWNANGDGKFEAIQTISSDLGFFNDLKVDVNANILITSSLKLIVIRSLSDFKCIFKLSLDVLRTYARSIEILPENRLIIATQNNTLAMWCLTTRRLLNEFNGHSSLVNKLQIYIF